ncbi:related to DNA repair protein MUS-42 [Melanopsichium pennsylvanicum]|uniref:DNA repair protein REV1 n=2 Tax=Melanopsichium pennsylvanicum TaxID=63383 RepID=A0AAJ5C651_9BASI|nr:related to DNA repair protein MUS-42 [Melanopsichium pennsylvanicum 4]SNX85426.1 related to DNA repair protein MUS-42 [Melanopsichium pennsylvanicum]
MHNKPTPKQQDVGEVLRSPRKRKVQWADQDDHSNQPTTLLASTSHTNEYTADLSRSYVDDHGMLVSTNSNHEASPTKLEPADPETSTTDALKKQYLASEIYNPIEYGDFRSYMNHKRAKLKVQEASLLQEEEALLRVTDSPSRNTHCLPAEIRASGGKRSNALKGCCVYINGQTHPPYSELRRLLVLHGGDLMAYLDQKTPVTHIVASNLTPKKRIEFKDYKVVLPGWILESIELGRKADWRKWRCDAITGSNGHTSMSLVGKSAEASATGSGLSDWRNLNKSAKLPRQLPTIDDQNESPWGKQTNQTNLLDRFRRTEKPPQNVSDTMRSAKTATLAPESASGPSPKPAQPKENVQSKVVRFGDDEVVAPATSSPNSSVQATFDSTGISPTDAVVSSTEQKTIGQTQHDAAPISLKDINMPDETVVTPTKPADKADHSIGTDPASKNAAFAVSRGHYASRPSNTHAARLLASPSWRQRNTATSEGFLAGYFAKSRLHHLSTWKTSLQDMVSSALREAGRPLGSADLPKGLQRVIMHIDFDSFFVAVGLKKRLDLQDKPVVVCHGTGFGMPSQKPGDENRPADNQSSSTSEIASCSYKAREFGIRNGMSLGQAKRLCPQIETIPYDFEAYDSISLTFYTFLLEHSDALQAVSVDEALIDVSLLLQSMRVGDAIRGSLYDRYRDHLGSQGQSWTAEKQLAEAFRDEIRERCGCEVSIGIGSNILLARLATRKAKPGGSFHLTDDGKQAFLDALDVDDLHGIGWSLRERIRELFETINIGEILSKTTKSNLIAEFGPKKGKMVWDKMHGIDADRLEGNKLRQSVGSHVNYGIRFLTEQEAENFVTGMCQEVSQRARAVKLRGRQVSVQVMVRAKDAPVEAPKFLGHGVCDTHHRSVQVSGPGGVAIDDETRIRAAAWPLIRDLKADPKELRGIAISLTKLEPAEGNALSPGKPKGGQSLLRFGSTASISPQSAAVSAARAMERKGFADRADPTVGGEWEETSDSEQPDEVGVELPTSLEKGPEAATPRRPGVSDSVKVPKTEYQASESTPTRLPPPTQLMLPSKSQIDPDVFNALPTQYRRQIEAKFGPAPSSRSSVRAVSPDSDIDRTLVATPLPSSLAPTSSLSRPRVLPRSTPTTPQKAKAAPSPAMASALMLPSASQIDPSVFAELPESVRKEIERQLGYLQSSSGVNPVEDTPSPGKKTPHPSTLMSFLNQSSKANDGKKFLFRSMSESPTKKRVVSRLLGNPSKYAHVDEPVMDKDAALAMDASKVSNETLEALGIDAEVFRALPVELQREIFWHHSEQKKSEKARFKAGKTNNFEEITMAEQRRRATLRAAHNEIVTQKQIQERIRAHAADGINVFSKAKIKKGAVGVGGSIVEEKKEKEEEAEVRKNPPLYLVAKPKWRKPKPQAKLFGSGDVNASSPKVIPSIRGIGRYEEIDKLIGQWVSAFAEKGPRKGDVDRIGGYLADLVRAASEVRVEHIEKATSLMGLIDQRLGMEELKGIRVEKSEWEQAKRRIRQAMQAQARLMFCGAEVAP